MSTTIKGLPNACPTCYVEAGQRCVTRNGVETNAHTPRVHGQWPVLEHCYRSPKGHEMVGAACPLCGHTNLVHPQRFGNPALTECAICLVLGPTR